MTTPQFKLSPQAIKYLVNLINTTHEQFNLQHVGEPLKPLSDPDFRDITYANEQGDYEQLYYILEDAGSNLIYDPAYWAIADLLSAMNHLAQAIPQLPKLIEQPEKLSVSDFEHDLIHFIRNHSYMKQEEADVQVKKSIQNYVTTICCHTVNGEYEQVKIHLNLMA